MANKMTKKEMFNAIKAIEAVAANEEMVAFIDHEIELLNRKRSSGTMTETQKKNEELKEVILEVLQGSNPMTVTEIRLASEELSKYENQKISALVRQLILAEKVVKTTDKKKSLFSLA